MQCFKTESLVFAQCSALILKGQQKKYHVRAGTLSAVQTQREVWSAFFLRNSLNFRSSQASTEMMSHRLPDFHRHCSKAVDFTCCRSPIQYRPTAAKKSLHT